MTFELALRWFKAAALIAITMWEIIQLARHRNDMALRILVPGLVLLSIAATIGIRTPVLEPIKDFFGSWWPILINGCWMAMAYCFAAYFVLANDQDKPMSTRKRQALLELSFFVAAITTLILVYQTAPPGTWHTPRLPEDYRTWRNALFYLSVDGYSLTVWVIGVRRALRYLRRLEHPWARAALLLVIAGSAGLSLGVDGVSLARQTIRAFYPHAELDILSTLYSTGQLGGQLLLAAGFVLAPLASAVVTARTRYDRALRARYTRRLTPLWQLLTTEFPDIVLSPHHDHHTKSDNHNDDFENITDEITDGLAELARDCPRHTSDTRDPTVAADLITAGLARRAVKRNARWTSEQLQPIEPPYTRIEPEFHGNWRNRAQWMINIGDELTKRGLIPQKDQEYAQAPAN